MYETKGRWNGVPVSGSDADKGLHLFDLGARGLVPLVATQVL